jgi:hypothetical protein
MRRWARRYPPCWQPLPAIRNTGLEAGAVFR